MPCQWRFWPGCNLILRDAIDRHQAAELILSGVFLRYFPARLVSDTLYDLVALGGIVDVVRDAPRAPDRAAGQGPCDGAVSGDGGSRGCGSISRWRLVSNWSPWRMSKAERLLGNAAKRQFLVPDRGLITVGGVDMKRTFDVYQLRSSFGTNRPTIVDITIREYMGSSRCATCGLPQCSRADCGLRDRRRVAASGHAALPHRAIRFRSARSWRLKLAQGAAGLRVLMCCRSSGRSYPGRSSGCSGTVEVAEPPPLLCTGGLRTR
jgi:hypothetical protein